eukprot:g2367.t1
MDPPKQRAANPLLNFERKLQTIGPIIGANVAVYCGWLAGAHLSAQTLLQKYFLLHPLSGRSLPLLLSAFSHMGFLHLACNMYALWSLGGLVLDIMPSEQFLATYVSAGALTAFASLGVSVLRWSPTPSLGASGAVLTVAAMSAAAMPDLQLSIIFLPWMAFPAWQIIQGLAALDAVGLALGWTFFDHAAHLAGYGLGYGSYETGAWRYIERYQRGVVDLWRGGGLLG